MDKKAVILGALLVGGFALLMMRGDAQPTAEQEPEPDQEPQEFDPSDSLTAYESLQLWTAQTYNEIDTMIQAPAPGLRDITPNVRAFIAMIAQAEGTANAGGYAALYGSRADRHKTFSSFADHPRIAQRISSTDQRWTTAAGLLQWMAVSPIPGGGFTKLNTWDRIKKKLNLTDFSPASQDAGAVELFAEAGALADIQAGRFFDAVRKVKGIWASLPGAGYGQGERTLAYVTQKYTDAGGAFA